MADNSNQTSVTFEAGEFIIREKTHADALYIVKDGQLEVYKTGQNGEKITIGMISSGQFVGETAVLTGKQHGSNVVALTPVRAIKLSRTSIEAQLKACPSWLVALTKGLVERLHHANDLLRKNGWVDENLSSMVKNIEDKYRKE